MRTRLGVVLAHVRVVGGAEADRALLALVAHVNAHQHRLVRDFFPELHPPEVAAELGVHLPDDVQENTVVVPLNRPVRHELGNHRAVAVDFVFQKGVEVLVVRMVGHNDQKDELGVFYGPVGITYGGEHLFVVVILNALRKGVQKMLLVVGRLVGHGADVGVRNFNV